MLRTLFRFSAFLFSPSLCLHVEPYDIYVFTSTELLNTAWEFWVRSWDACCSLALWLSLAPLAPGASAAPWWGSFISLSACRSSLPLSSAPDSQCFLRRSWNTCAEPMLLSCLCDVRLASQASSRGQALINIEPLSELCRNINAWGFTQVMTVLILYLFT